ncbi:hypothetical protein SacmaDRAFT_2277 [Saccharomonospora marina XMU15]|uniref:LytR/CpsA/Psr regulator C-terminal domain-containing protein n=1 Tax=Saccharomonospora marina XMU15 TaxID=882083 RepID=H5WWH3_9PSEU|nr:envelope integrity protein Cei [Saccharomonospora marina]EHR50529.1 hypothetical protein SacmaDRAFT_2277 [Saccharomonospora marina XMU15]
MPALAVLSVLGLAAVFVWVNAISSTEDLEAAIRCEPPATPPPGVTYTPLPPDGLAGTPPIPPDRVAVRVLNASGARGEAAMTTEAMRRLGFSQIAEPQNDDAYPTKVADCHGQVRFGENGAGAARTVALVDPCLQLVRDNRQDASVDLAVGTEFNDVRPSPSGLEIIQRLNAWSVKHQGKGNNEQSAPGGGPVIDEELFEQAGPQHC